MTSLSLAATCLMFALLVPGGSGNDLESLLNAFQYFALQYEYGQTSSAAASYNQLSNELPSYLQEGQHGDSRSAENMALASRYIYDVALLLNSPDAAGLKFPSIVNFTNFITESQAFVCPAQTCDETEIYRRLDDTCNNLEHPLQGAAFSTQQRNKEARGSWEKTSLVQYELNQNPGFYFDTRNLGVTPTFNDYPFIFKASGNSPLRLSVFSTDIKEDSLTFTCSGNPCRIYVPGAIYSVANKQGCRVDEDIFFTEGGNMVEIENGGTKNCHSKSYTVRYYKYLADLTIQPESSTDDSVLTIPGQADETSSDNKFASDSVKRYWLNIGADQSVNISSGTEYSISEVFLSSNLGLASAPNLKKLFVSVGLEEDGAVSSPENALEFVNREVYQVATYGNTPVLSNYGIVDNLDTIPFTYDYYTFRWGIRHPNSGAFNVTLTSRDNTVLTLTVDMANLTNSGFSYSGTSTPEVADYSTIQEVGYQTTAGDNYNSHDAFYLAWHFKYMYFGYGNEIGRNLITTQALEMTDLERFGATEIVLSSTHGAYWVIDIEQPNQPRRSSYSTGEELASSLDVAMLLHANDGTDGFSQEITIAAFQWGQYLDHDVIATPLATVDGHAPVCCSNFHKVNDSLYTEEICFEIPINNNFLTDTELSPFTTTLGNCLEFGRSASAFSCNGDGDDYRILHPLNIITTHIDSSNVYGSSDAEALVVRNSSSGGLAVQLNPFTDAPEMPRAKTAGEACSVEQDVTLTVSSVTKSVYVNCTHGGDFRANEQSSLAGMHTLFVREHNRIANELLAYGYSENTEAEREELFQVTRHIIGAINQVITYQHWLPSFMSDTSYSTKYKLDRKFCRYDNQTNAAMQNLFGIIFRMGHTWIPQDLMGDPTESGHPNAYSSKALNNNFFNATPAYHKGSNAIMSNWHKSCAGTNPQMVDAVVKQLFGNGDGNPENVSTNLAALNNQRGRDHGVQTYRDILKLYLPDNEIPNSIDEILDFGYVTSDVYEKLKRLYHSIDDIDAFTAGLMESPMDSTSSVGRVINEVLGDMFRDLRKSDRFWYACYFSNQAKREIEKATLGRIMCDNIDGYSDIDTQEDLFRTFDANTNPTIACANRESMDLSKFSKSLNGGRDADFPIASSTSRREEPVNLTDGMMKLMRELKDDLEKMEEREEENDD